MQEKCETCWETNHLVAHGEWYIKVGYKGMDLVIPFRDKLKRSCEGSISRSHLRDIHGLYKKMEFALAKGN